MLHCFGRALGSQPTSGEYLALEQFYDRVQRRPGGISGQTRADILGAVMLAGGCPVDGFEHLSVRARVTQYMESQGHSRYSFPLKDMLDVLEGPLPPPEQNTVLLADLPEDQVVDLSRDYPTREYRPSPRPRPGPVVRTTLWDILDEE